MKCMNLGSKFFLSGVGLSVIGSSFASANPPRDGDDGKTDEKQQSASQSRSNDEKGTDAKEKSMFSKFFDYVKSLVLEFYYGKGYFETVAKLQGVSESAKEVLLNLNNFLEAIELEKIEESKELDKKYEKDEFFKTYSKELTDITKILLVEYKLKSVAEEINVFELWNFFKINNFKEREDLFLKLETSLKNLKNSFDEVCKDEKERSSVLLTDVGKSIESSLGYLEKINGIATKEENAKMNSENTNCAREIYETFGKNFCYESNYCKDYKISRSINAYSSKEFFTQHKEECEFLDGIRESVHNFLEEGGINKLKEKFKSKEELLSLLNYMEERLQKGTKVAEERHHKNLTNYREPHRLLLTKWTCTLEYFTNVFKVHCVEAFEGKPFSQSANGQACVYSFFQRF